MLWTLDSCHRIGCCRCAELRFFVEEGTNTTYYELWDQPVKVTTFSHQPSTYTDALYSAC